MKIFNKTFGFLNKNRNKIILLLLIELIFFILVFSGSLYVSNKIFQGFDALRSASFDQNLLESEEGLSQLNEQVGGLSVVANNIYLLVALSLIISFILFALFGSLSWLLSSELSFRENFNLKYVLNFSGITLFYFLAAVLIYFVLEYLVLDLNLFKQGVGALIISLLVILYFLVISYSLYLIKREGIFKIIKKSFILGIKKIHILLLMWGIIFLVVVLCSFILGLSESLRLYAGLVLFLGIIVLSRIFILNTVKEYC